MFADFGADCRRKAALRNKLNSEINATIEGLGTTQKTEERLRFFDSLKKSSGNYAQVSTGTLNDIKKTSSLLTNS